MQIRIEVISELVRKYHRSKISFEVMFEVYLSPEIKPNVNVELWKVERYILQALPWKHLCKYNNLRK